MEGEVSAGDRASPRGSDPLGHRRRSGGAVARLLGLRPLTVGVAIAILVLTGFLAVLAATVDHRDQQRVLDLRLRRAADVMSAAIRSIQPQLLDALQTAAVTGSPTDFETFAADNVRGPDGFTSLSLWQQTPTGLQLLATVGARPLLASLHGLANSFLGNLHPSRSLQVTNVLDGNPRAVGYAEMPLSDTSRLIVYAETQAPSWRPIAIPRAPAFKDLGLAEYLGPVARPSQLMEASVPTPIRGRRDSVSVPFGDTTITLVGTPTAPLSDALSAALPWVIGGAGALLAVAGGLTVETVLRRRLVAERLAELNARLYARERDVAETLQRALLAELPARPGVEVAARYLPGDRGVDVGGDWYDVSYPADRRCTFVVGDVSGRGLGAATTMASLRFGARAYLTQGDSPRTVLGKLDRLLQADVDHRIATVLVGELDLDRRRLSLASAGHFAPLLVEGGRVRFLEVATGPPIGTGTDDRPGETIVNVAPGTSLLAFTDGLVERRGEHLDEGLTRLVETVGGAVAGTAAALPTEPAPALAVQPTLAAGPARAAEAPRGRFGAVLSRHDAVEAQAPLRVDELVDRVATTLLPAGSEDDVVILALAWSS